MTTRTTEKAPRTTGRTRTPAIPTEAHLEGLRQYAHTAHARRGEPLAAVLADLTRGMGDRKRLAVVLDACEGLIALAAGDPAALARSFGPETGRDLERAQYRASVAFALILGDRLGGATPPTNDDGARLAA